MFAFVSGGASYVFCLCFPTGTAFACYLLPPLLLLLLLVPTVFLKWFYHMLVTAAGSSWLLTATDAAPRVAGFSLPPVLFSAYIRLTFCLRFSYKNNGPVGSAPAVPAEGLQKFSICMQGFATRACSRRTQGNPCSASYSD